MTIQQAERTDLSVEERNSRTIRRVFDEFVNRGDFSVVDEIYSEEMVDHEPLPGAPEGLEGVRYTIAGLREGFPDLKVTIEAMSAHGNHVVIHNTWRGTHLGDFLGMAPTGRALEFQGIVVWRLLDNGLIAERWGVGVESNMLGELGMRRLAPAARGAARTASRRGARSVSSVLPVRAGRAARFAELRAELAGPRLRGYEASRRRAGVLEESFDLRVVDGREVVVHRIEARDALAAARKLVSSSEPFDVWLRESAAEVFELDPAEALVGAAQVSDGWAWSSVNSQFTQAG